jgi:hypothetical protein
MHCGVALIDSRSRMEYGKATRREESMGDGSNELQ